MFQYSNSRDTVLPREHGQDGPTVFVHGVIGIGYRHLTFVDIPEGSKGLCASEYINQCLTPIARQLKGQIFQADGARVHHTMEVKEWLEKKRIQSLPVPWAAHSPDMNPIENLWAIVSRAVAERAPFGREELREYVLQEWQKVPEGVVNALCESFARRCKDVIARNGRSIDR